MKRFFIDKLARIIKARKQLEKELNVKISNNGKEITIDGTPEEEYIAEKIINAVDFGFPSEIALFVKEEDFLFEIINIKNHTKRTDLERIRARIIGTKRKTLNAIEQLTKCFFQVKGNEVAIIGDAEFIPNAQEAIISLIRGAKQANVYAYLEKHQVMPVIDLGLKIKEKKE